jgi:hypothetical protein
LALSPEAKRLEVEAGLSPPLGGKFKDKYRYTFTALYLYGLQIDIFTLLVFASIHCHRYEFGYEENSSSTYKFYTEYIVHVNNYEHVECPKFRIENKQVRIEAINS